MRIAATPRVASTGASAGQRAAGHRLARDALARDRRRSAGTDRSRSRSTPSSSSATAGARARRRRGYGRPRRPRARPPRASARERQEQLVDEPRAEQLCGEVWARPRTAAFHAEALTQLAPCAAGRSRRPLGSRAYVVNVRPLRGQAGGGGGQDHDPRAGLAQQGDVLVERPRSPRDDARQRLLAEPAARARWRRLGVRG